MDVRELMAGVAIVIDDEIDDKYANIKKITAQLVDNKFPFLAYAMPPAGDEVKNFKDISFVVLDWQMDGLSIEDRENGVASPYGDGELAIDFIQALNGVCFAPIFIFSNEAEDDIKKTLIEKSLYTSDGHNHIFIAQKESLKECLFEKIEEWLKKTPSMYALKEWDRAFYKARKDLFWSFYKINPEWPIILWSTYGSDGVNKSMELGETISKNIHSRIEPFEFEPGIMTEAGCSVSREEIRAVMEGERYITNAFIPNDMIHTGDLFKDGRKYYLNIRPNCDCIAREGEGCSIEDISLYLLIGSTVSINSKEQVTKLFNSEYGNFIENDTFGYLFPIDNGRLIRFNFKDIKIDRWAEWKTKRLGRVLPPYIVRIQQKYSAYLQRQGLNRIPIRAVNDA